MDKEELQKIITKLESENLEKDAYFGIFMYGGDSDESYIKANKQGLELFAANLLKASNEVNELLSSNEEEVYDLDFDWIDENSETIIQYIEPTLESGPTNNSETYQETWKDKIQKMGCIAVLVLVLASIIIGLATIIKWII